MAEEEKKPEEKKPEEKKPAAEEAKKPAEEAKPAEKPASEEKKEEKKAEEGKKEGKEAPPPPPPQEIVLKVYMHCEGCAKKVRKCLKGFEGIEDVQTDCKSHKVIVKGEKADPLKVLERVQKKSHRQVELLSPIPKPPAEEKEVVKVDEKKEEPPQVITVVLRVHMHCEACAQEIRRRIQRMKGVESVEADLKSSQVTVKGVFDPQALVNYVHKRTGKHATIVKQDPEKKEEKPKEESKEEEKKGEEGGGEKKEKKEGGDEAAKAEKKGEEAAKATEVEEGVKVVESMKNEFYYNYPQYPQYPQRYVMDMYANTYAPQISYAPQITYAPQIFSDENPNACSVM